MRSLNCFLPHRCTVLLSRSKLLLPPNAHVSSSVSSPSSFPLPKDPNSRSNRHQFTPSCTADFLDDPFETTADEPSTTSLLTLRAMSSSEDEASDGEVVDSVPSNDDFIFAVNDPRRKIMRMEIWMKIGLASFLSVLLLFFDWWGWKIVRLPLKTLLLSKPFFISAVLSFLSSFLFISKRKSHGIFIIFIGCIVSKHFCGSSVEISMAAFASLALAFISRFPTFAKLIVEICVGVIFSVWFENASVSSPYHMRYVVPLPAPVGVVCLKKWYPFLSILSFVTMAYVVNSTGSRDVANGGAFAVAFIGMAIAVLPISSDMAVYGASMAGACVGFWLHYRCKGLDLMGLGFGFGLGLGGGLCVMASTTGMFFPLYISCAIFWWKWLLPSGGISYFAFLVSTLVIGYIGLASS